MFRLRRPYYRLNIAILAAILTLLFSRSEAVADTTADYPGAFDNLYRYSIERGALNMQPSLFTGAATFSIPIVPMPGVDGMVPSLALTYNSRNSGGNAGKGWTIGLPTITRSTKYGVGKAQICGPILCPNSNETTVYLYNDQELIFDGPGGYDPFGCPVTRYYTEKETFEKILFCSGLGGSAAKDGSGASNYWTVIHQDGSWSTFGKRADSSNDPAHSRLWTQNGFVDDYLYGPQVLIYYLDEVGNQRGTSWRAYYSEYAADGIGSAPRLLYVKYPFINGNPLYPGRTIEIYSEVIQSPYGSTIQYLYNMPLIQNRRVSYIAVWRGLTVVRKYDLSYIHSAQSGASLLESVQEYGIAGCVSDPSLPCSNTPRPTKTSFTYHSAEIAVDSNPVSYDFPNAGIVNDGLESDDNYGSTQTLIDFNGDSFIDVLSSRLGMGLIDGCKSTEWCWVYWAGLEDGDFDSTPMVIGGHPNRRLTYSTHVTVPGQSLSYTRLISALFDMNGDGLLDYYDSGKPHTYKRNAGGYFVDEPISFTEQSTPGSALSLQESQPTTFAMAGHPPSTWDIVTTRSKFVDVDGDGCADRLSIDFLNRWTYERNRMCDRNPSNMFDAKELWRWDGLTPVPSPAPYLERTQGEHTDSGSLGLLRNDWGTTILADLNGDGLVDLYHSVPTGTQTHPWRATVYFGTGRGFITESNVSSYADDINHFTGEIEDTALYFSRVDDRARVQLVGWLDTNGDGLSDHITTCGISYNHGQGLDTASCGDNNDRFLLYPNLLVTSEVVNGYFGTFVRTTDRLMDFNGTGRLDRLHYEPATSTLEVNYNYDNRSQADLLAIVDNGRGAKVRFTYAAYALRRASVTQNIHTPPMFNVTVLAETEIFSTANETRWSSQEYYYSDAFFDRDRLTFRGFGTVEVEDRTKSSASSDLRRFTRYTFAVGNTAAESYREDGAGVEHHDCAECAGLLVHMETGPSREDIKREVWNEFIATQHSTISGNAIRWPRLHATREYSPRPYPHESKRRETRFRFDLNYGVLTAVQKYGDWDDPTDDSTLLLNYDFNVTNYVVSLPWRIRTCSGLDLNCSELLTEHRFFYDNCYCSRPTAGDVVIAQQRVLYDAEDYWVTSRLQYDKYGNLTQAVDPEGGVVSITYDNTDHIYPVTQSQTVVKTDDVLEIGENVTFRIETSWDYNLALPEETWDVNGVYTHMLYDPFGRVIQIDRSTPAISVVHGVTPRAGDVVTLATLVYNEGPDEGANSIIVKRYWDSSPSAFLSATVYYDGLDRPIQESSGGSAVARQYDVLTGYLAQQTFPFKTPLGAAYTEFDFESVVPASDVWSRKYDWAGRLIETSLRSNCGYPCEYYVGRIDYDDMDWTYEDSPSVGGPTRFILDGHERVSHVSEYDQTRDRRGIVSYEYDVSGNLTQYEQSQTQPVIPHSSILSHTVATYDSRGLLRTLVDPDLSNCANPESCPFRYSYDHNGRLIRIVIPDGRAITYRRDELGRVYYIDYCSNGLIPNCGDENNDHQYTYDNYYGTPGDLYRLTLAQDRNDQSDSPNYVSYEYDTWGRLIQETRRVYDETRTTGYEYDLLGRVTKLIYPSGGPISGSPLQDSPAGELALFTANADNHGYFFRPKQNLEVTELCGNFGGTHDVRIYELNNGWQEIASTSVTSSFDWKCAPIPSTLLSSGVLYKIVVNFTTKQTSYRYENVACPCETSLGTILGGHYGGGSYDPRTIYGLVDFRGAQQGSNDEVHYFYSSDTGRLQSVYWESGSNGETPSQSIVRNINYDYAGRVRAIEWGNGLTTSQYYNDTSGAPRRPGRQLVELSMLSERNNDIVSILNRQWYTYDDTGNIASVADYATTSTYEYDYAGRLTRTTLDTNDVGTDHDWQYTYSTDGNILSWTDANSGESHVYSYGQNNAGPHAVTSIEHSIPSGGIPAIERLSYDLNGRPYIRWPADTNNTAYSYTIDGDLYRITYWCPDNSGYGDIYLYGDAIQARSLKYNTRSCGANAKLTYYLGQHFEIRRENYNELGDTSYDERYILIAGQRVAYITQRYPGQIFYLHPDHIGSVSYITNEIGEEIYQRRYSPFGMVLDSSGQDIDLNIGYTGQEEDSEVGLVHLGVRQYDPSLGRWLTPDIMVPTLTQPQSFNRYGYVMNNPVNFVDPSGFQCIDFNYNEGYPGLGLACLEPPTTSSPQFEPRTPWTGAGSLELIPFTFRYLDKSFAELITDNEVTYILGLALTPGDVEGGEVDIWEDTGHALVFVEEVGVQRTILSVGPDGPILDDPKVFLEGALPAIPDWPIYPDDTYFLFTWEISADQYLAGLAQIHNYQDNAGCYTAFRNCSSAAANVVRSLGITMPSGIGPVQGIPLFSFPTPYHLARELWGIGLTPQIVHGYDF